MKYIHLLKFLLITFFIVLSGYFSYIQGYDDASESIYKNAIARGKVELTLELQGYFPIDTDKTKNGKLIYNQPLKDMNILIFDIEGTNHLFIDMILRK